MATAEGMARSLAEAAGKGNMGSEAELGRFAVDGAVPKAVVFPTGEGELASIIGKAAREGWAVAPRGSGRLTALGNRPRRLDLVVGMERLARPIEHAAGDLTVTAGAGTTLDALQATLAGEGQWLPLDPPLGGKRTLGGILATNLAGPLSLGFGTARDMVLGLRVVGADGAITKSGGRVVKNVTGFDVAKVHLGALGTLGIIVEASLKAHPLPKGDVTLSAVVSPLERAMAASQEMCRSQHSPQALELAAGPEGGRCTLYARYLGTDAGVNSRLREGHRLVQEAGAEEISTVEQAASRDIWRKHADFGWEGADGTAGLTLRLGCLSSRIGRLASGVLAIASDRGEMGLLIGPGRGTLRCRFAGAESWGLPVVQSLVLRLRELATSLGGFAVVERCSTEAKEGLDVWGDPGPGLPLMRRLKEQMDPKGMLNPGRYVGGI